MDIPLASRPHAALPPGQRALDRFPRFGTHLHRPPPPVPSDPRIEIVGAVTGSFVVPLTQLAALPRTQLTADFHCVAGWSATDLRWDGVSFKTFYRQIITPLLPPGTTISHVLFGGLDGYESVVTIEDAMADDVLIADHLNGHPLDADHGAPARLVSPAQYGYKQAKHLCRIELHTAEPARELGTAHPLARVALRGPLVMRHPRARVWAEERHPYIPARFLRPFYRLLIRPGAYLCERGGRRGRNSARLS